jgi:DSF synthase
MTFVNSNDAMSRGVGTRFRIESLSTPQLSGPSGSRLRAAQVQAMVEAEHYTELDASVAQEDGALWCYMKPRERPSFTRQLLADLSRLQKLITDLFADTDDGGAPFTHLVFGSREPGVFNLGGDLTLFSQRIMQHDRAGLLNYANACVDVAFANHDGYGNRIMTVALVQGDALGGGFEAALSCDLIVAERQAKFGLPEILFNLFPGMGAYSFLSRRVGARKAEELILSGRVHTAEEMHGLGIVDILAENGGGERAVREHIARNRAKHNAHSAVCKVRRRVNPVTIAELRDVTELWVDAALHLTEQDLRKMAKLAAAQARLRLRVAGVRAAA